MKILSLTLGLLLGCGITLIVSGLPIFKPFNFGFIESDKYKFFLQQAIEIPVPMADHVTSVWIQDKTKPVYARPWVYIGKVHTDPFDLKDVTISESKQGITVRFPWGASLRVPILN